MNVTRTLKTSFFEQRYHVDRQRAPYSNRDLISGKIENFDSLTSPSPSDDLFPSRIYIVVCLTLI